MAQAKLALRKSQHAQSDHVRAPDAPRAYRGLSSGNLFLLNIPPVGSLITEATIWKIDDVAAE